ncbi:hypothetical protein [Leuconostoc mesenteroides]|uniref:hypothetical protein n=1 Tax=Leuconostoc mesenteroides TaxID=1245 RepID=UPI00235E2468|nr:hypothetical protein [Leuconostoc mesenteroides]
MKSNNKDLIAQLERIQGDIDRINNQLPANMETVKYYGKAASAFLPIMIGRIKNVR